MSKTISSDEFANEVINMLKTYTTDVEMAIDDEVLRVGDNGANELRQAIMPMQSASGIPPANAMKRREWNSYAKGWQNNYVQGSNYSSSTIHNKTHYRLVHLLEYGHATRNGKRTRAFAHVKPVEDKCDKELLDNVKKIIEKGGKL